MPMGRGTYGSKRGRPPNEESKMKEARRKEKVRRKM